MNIYEKMKAIQEFCKKIRPDIRICFDTGDRSECDELANTYASFYWKSKEIVIRKQLLLCTINSCYHSALHEFAHLFQLELYGFTNHNNIWEGILRVLIDTYGSYNISIANLSQKPNNAASIYKCDKPEEVPAIPKGTPQEECPKPMTYKKYAEMKIGIIPGKKNP